MDGPGADARELPRDPYDGPRIENDILGVRVWGPPTQPTLSIGRSDIWDRRWMGDRTPPVTLARLRELAREGRLTEVARSPNDTVYDAYGRYDFPCPKPGAQLILGTPFATSATVAATPDGGLKVSVEGRGKSVEAGIWVALARPMVVLEVATVGLTEGDLWLRVYRHRDTIVPGEPVDPTLGGKRSSTDFEQLPAPQPYRARGCWGILQRFLPEATFPEGFRFVVAATTLGAETEVAEHEGQRGLGTPLWAEKEGHVVFGLVKRYTPINEAPGAAATATFQAVPHSFTVVATAATTQDGADPARVAARTLDEARRLGIEGLRAEQERVRKRGTRRERAWARVGQGEVAAPAFVFPRLRRPRGYYGDVPLCSVASTRLAFQDAAPWHGDFHLNEVRAEGMLTLGQFEELLPYCEMIRTLLPQARENARDVYSLPGAMYPLVHFPLRCRGIAHTNLTWEQDIGLNGLASKPLWLYYRYTGDRRFLRDLAYPVLSECARFCAAYLSEEADGRLHMVPTVSPEHWGLTAGFERNRDCTSALTLTRYLLRAAADAATVLGMQSAEAKAWRAMADRLAPYPTWATAAGPVWVDVAGAPPIEYNIPVPLSPVFWGDDVGLDSDAETLALARRTLDQIQVWVPHRGYLDSCVRPRLGIWRPGAYIGPENLLLSYQSIHVFPAAPPDADIEMRDYAAEGGFRVSASRKAGAPIEGVRVHSTLGGPCRIASPWPGRPVAVLDGKGRERVRTAATASHVVFATRRGGTYRLEPR